MRPGFFSGVDRRLIPTIRKQFNELTTNSYTEKIRFPRVLTNGRNEEIQVPDEIRRKINAIFKDNFREFEELANIDIETNIEPVELTSAGPDQNIWEVFTIVNNRAPTDIESNRAYFRHVMKRLWVTLKNDFPGKRFNIKVRFTSSFNNSMRTVFMTVVSHDRNGNNKSFDNAIKKPYESIGHRIQEIGASGVSKGSSVNVSDDIYFGSTEYGETTLLFSAIELIYVEIFNFGNGSNEQIEKVNSQYGTHKIEFNPQNTESCFFDCLNFIDNRITYKNNLGVNIDESVKTALQKAEYYKYVGNIQVLKYNDGHIDVVFKYNNERIKNKTKYAIMYIDNHFVVIRKISDEKLRASKPKKDRLYGFFDFETVSRPDLNKDRFVPYSLKCVFFTESQLLEDNTDFSKPTNMFDCRDFDDTNFDKTMIERFINYVISLSKSFGKVYLVSWNGSRFDNTFILNHLSERSDIRVKKTSCMTSGTSYKIDCGNFCLVDLCLMMPGELKKTCEAFQCKYGKIDCEVTFDQLNEHYYSNEFLTEKQINDFHKYNMYDCYAIAELCSKFLKCIPQILNLTDEESKKFRSEIFEQYYTAGGMSIHFARKSSNHLDNIFKIDKYDSFKTYEFIRKSVFAGRVEAAEPGKHTGNFTMIDITSSYPNTMYNDVYPAGIPIKTDNYVSGKLGIYRVKIISQPNYVVIPRRVKNKALDYKYRGKMDVILNTVDIDELRANGAIFKIKDGYYFEEESDTMFKDYLDSIFTAKSEQDRLVGQPTYNKAKRELCKLLMNSISGKVIESFHEDICQVIYDSSELDGKDIETIDVFNKFTIIYGKKNPKLKDIQKVPIFIGSFIYSYARRNLSKAMRYNGMYCDTDSVIMRNDDFIRFWNDNPRLMVSNTDASAFGGEHPDTFEYDKNALKELGRWEIEYTGECELFIIAKKIYGIFPIDNKQKKKFRIKGISPKAIYKTSKDTEGNEKVLPEESIASSPKLYFEEKINGNSVKFSTKQFIRQLKKNGDYGIDIIIYRFNKEL